MNPSMKAYLEEPGLSSTDLTMLAKSPDAYRKYKDGEVSFSSSSMNVGSALHAVYEGGWQQFDLEFTVLPAHIDRRTKIGKESYKAFIDQNSDKTILTADETNRVMEMVNSLTMADDPLLRMILDHPQYKEVNYVWDENGIKCKCRADIMIDANDELNSLLELLSDQFHHPLGNKLCLDIKTSSTNVGPEDWPWTVRKYRYDLKAAHYLAGTMANAFGWIAIESTPPYSVALYWMGEHRMERCAAYRKKLMATLIECQATHHWPGLRLTPQQAILD